MTALIRRHPVPAFFVIAFGVSWLGVTPLVLHALGVWRAPISPRLHLLGALGPVTAALVVTAVSGGRSGLAGLWKSIASWRVGAMAWVVAALSPVALAGVAAILLNANGVTELDFGRVWAVAQEPDWVAHLAIAAVGYGIFEEIGWRGVALPRLQFGRSALWATLILTFYWGLWHLPYFSYLYGMVGVASYVGFYACFGAGALWLTFLYNSTGGSVLMTMVWHASWNVVNLVTLAVSPDLAIATNVLLIPVGIAVLVTGSTRLSLRGKMVLPPPYVPSGPRRALA